MKSNTFLKIRRGNLLLLLALLAFGQAAWAQNLVINSVDDWNTFAQTSPTARPTQA